MVQFILEIQKLKICFSTSEGPATKLNPNRVGCQNIMGKEKRKLTSTSHKQMGQRIK